MRFCARQFANKFLATRRRLRLVIALFILTSMPLVSILMAHRTKLILIARSVLGLQRQRLPQCLIIGVRKGGTRALIKFLSLHPSIQAQGREVHFFDVDSNYFRGLDWYRGQMPPSSPNQITMEKTPAYFCTELAPVRVHRMNSSIRILLVVRDPVARSVSDYLQFTANRMNRRRSIDPFEALAINSWSGRVLASYPAIERSIYHLHLSRWLEYFAIEQFHFVDGENLVRTPIDELRKVEDFLGIEHLLDEGYLYFNRTRGFYCTYKDGVDQCLGPAKGRTHPNITETVRTKLRGFFRPHNERFYAMTGRDFGWSR